MHATTDRMNFAAHEEWLTFDWASLGHRVRQRSLEAIAQRFVAMADGSTAAVPTRVLMEEISEKS